jgi:hypothetical protein
LFSYLGTKLCSAVGRTLGCAATMSSALTTRRPAVRSLCVVMFNWKTVASGWSGMAATCRGYESATLLLSAVTADGYETGVASRGITLHTKRRIA